MSSGKGLITRESFISKSEGHGKCSHCGQLDYGSYYKIKLGRRRHDSLFFCNEHTDDADSNAGIEKYAGTPLKPLSEITQEYAAECMRLYHNDNQSHGVRISHGKDGAISILKEVGVLARITISQEFISCDSSMNDGGVKFSILACLIRKGYDLGELSKAIQEVN